AGRRPLSPPPPPPRPAPPPRRGAAPPPPPPPPRPVARTLPVARDRAAALLIVCGDPQTINSALGAGV
ncbi:hypothetical protein ACIP3B_27495, partial [Streptomyces anulatus]